LVLQVWCCVVKHGLARLSSLEGRSNFSSTIYCFSILCMEHHYCGDQQWRSLTWRSIVTIGLSRTVSEINGAKIANFSYPVYISPTEGVTLGIGYQRRVRKKTTRMMGLPDGRKSFKIGLTV